jgi:PAS domain S-box-containing protein
MTAGTAGSRPRILVVDDDLGPRESLRMLLKSSYEIRTAVSGAAALTEVPHYRPDLVILDIKMPGMNGLDVLRHVKDSDPSIEVVMITAYASLETVKQALTHGAFEYLIKPFSRQDLEDVVRRALDRRQHEVGARSAVSRLVEEMRTLSAKTVQLEEAARRETAEQSLRFTQLSLLREMSRTFVGQLDASALAATVTGQLRTALGYDHVEITGATGPPAAPPDLVVVSEIRDAEGVLGALVVDNRASGRVIDLREREWLEMLAEYLAIALRNAHLYGRIEETKRSLEQLIASAGDAIVTVDAATDRIEGWNPAAERIFGLGGTDAVGRPVTDVLASSSYEEAKRGLGSAGSLSAFETRAVSGASAGANLAVTLSASGGRLIAIVRDVTAQREREAQLHQSDKLKALGQLAGGIAHDFNNLLQAILGYTQLMRLNPANVEFVTRSLGVVEAAATDGSETVRRIQEFARLRPEERFVPVDVNRVVHDAVAITRPRWDENDARSRHALHLALDLGDVPMISGRPAALTEVMTNLILNAIDAMVEGGTLTITTRRGGDDTAVVRVRDTGIGMPEGAQRRIFEPFFSTKGENGSGLGLAMVYSIVKRHGGEIEVESRPGEGAIFTLTFAGAPPAAPPELLVESQATRPASRVLLVDDDPKVLDTLAELLIHTGHTVTPVPGGEEALGEFEPGRFDAVVCDLGMKGMNGWELAERLRQADSRVPILFVTGWGLREDEIARTEALRISRCLFKPVRPDELDAAVRDAVESSDTGGTRRAPPTPGVAHPAAAEPGRGSTERFRHETRSQNP